ncbi:hypothetical protein [uncultured Ellagibacter sp.]|uniref:hypothetical protein n=1 Tax=uncultured Ellagibacter sp. TaxID=2137580 RepID=UPI00260D7510|nr:hypothetical protein [uncultured Ellagibacter sp.]
MAAEEVQKASVPTREEALQETLTEKAGGEGVDVTSCGEGALVDGDAADAGASAAVEAGAPGVASTGAPDAAAAGLGAADLGDASGALGEGESADNADGAAQAQQAGPTPEERELAENNALADVFDDVRRQSSDSQLVVPSRWVDLGLVPGHMTADEFEMLVYEYLENYRRDHKDEIAAEKAERARKANSVRSATRAVGVPPKIPNRRLRQIEEDEKAAVEKAARETSEAKAASGDAVTDDISAVAALGAKNAAAPDPSSHASEAQVEVAEGARASARTDAMESPAPHVSEAASDAPAEGASASEKPDAAADDGLFSSLKLPEGYKLVELEGEYVLVPDEDAAPVKKEIHCEHIVTLVGQHSYYLYDSDLMTKNYAHWAFLAAEDNPLATFVDCVREDGRVYPRPFAAEDLANPPFHMSASKVEDTWAELQKSGEYPDIERCEASNGDVYFFSTLYMDRTLAESLAEYRSVERLSNV